jgi:hypothetical protein
VTKVTMTLLRESSVFGETHALARGFHTAEDCEYAVFSRKATYTTQLWQGADRHDTADQPADVEKPDKDDYAGGDQLALPQRDPAETS